MIAAMLAALIAIPLQAQAEVIAGGDVGTFEAEKITKPEIPTIPEFKLPAVAEPELPDLPEPEIPKIPEPDLPIQ